MKKEMYHMTAQEVINHLETIEDKNIEIFCTNLIEFTAEETGTIIAAPDLSCAFPIKKIVPTTSLFREGVKSRKSILFGVHPIPVNLSKAETEFTEIEIEQ